MWGWKRGTKRREGRRKEEIQITYRKTFLERNRKSCFFYKKNEKMCDFGGFFGGGSLMLYFVSI